MSPARGGDAITTIPLRKATRDRLKQLGTKGDTYDSILNRLMDQLAPSPPPPSKTRRVPSETVVDFEPVD